MSNSSKRLANEAKNFNNQESVVGISAGPKEDDLYEWEAMIIGPKGTPYEDGLFELEIRIPRDYPYKPPMIKFKTKIYHCNIDQSGEICLDILRQEKWSPVLNLSLIHI